MSTRRTLLQAAAAAVVASALPARAQIVDLGEAINRAGRQRMLSQRMAKAYLALAMGVEPPLAQQVLDRSLATFDRQLVELKAFASTPELRETYLALEARWADYKTALVGSAPGRAGAAAVVAQSQQVLALAHKGTQQYEALLNKPVGRLVNLAGRERMLSQRMAAFHLASVVPAVEPAAAKAEIAKARSEFLAGLDTIASAPETTPRVRDELQLAQAQWILFDAALQRPPQASTLKPHADVFVASENVLVVMDRITTLYAGMKA